MLQSVIDQNTSCASGRLLRHQVLGLPFVVICLLIVYAHCFHVLLIIKCCHLCFIPVDIWTGSYWHGKFLFN